MSEKWLKLLTLALALFVVVAVASLWSDAEAGGYRGCKRITAAAAGEEIVVLMWDAAGGSAPGTGRATRVWWTCDKQLKLSAWRYDGNGVWRRTGPSSAAGDTVSYFRASTVDEREVVVPAGFDLLYITAGDALTGFLRWE